MEKQTNKTCPYCKEEVKSGAIKCKHCSSTLELEKPPHNGICPFCKEDIHSEAIKCKHCKSNLTKKTGGCGCVGQDVNPDYLASRRAPNLTGTLGSLCWGGCYFACRSLGGPHSECSLGCDLLCLDTLIAFENQSNVHAMF